jgi:Peptidase_C39 like family
MPKSLLVTVVAAFALAAAGPANAAQPYPVNFHNFLAGASVSLATTGVSGQFAYTDPYANYSGDGANGSGTYDYGTWTSPVYSTGFPFNELVASWNATTPAGTFVEISVTPQFADGHWGKAYILGRWSSRDSDFHRTSVGGQGDADGFVSIDTFFAKDHLAVAYQLQAKLFRRAQTTATPTLTRLSAIASDLTNQKNVFPSPTTMTGTTIDLGVPQYSQEIHHGEYPQFDNGGEAWCSPTSTSMVVAYWGRSPSAAETSWVNPLFADPWVDYTARYVYDYHYNGAGNWPFNTAYAAARGLVADVTQLHNLREAEAFVKAGIPLVASIAFTSNKLDGADIKSTNGHLVAIVGFTGDGSKVIVNDPASPTDADVKHYYDREQFERAWIPASGGIVYVIRPAGVATPSLTANNS